MRGRPLTAVEIERLRYVSQTWRRAPKADERERCALNLVRVVDRLYVDGVRLVTIQPHLNMTYSQLRRLRKTKPTASPVIPAETEPTRITFSPLNTSHTIGSTGQQMSTTAAASHANSLAEASASTYLRGDLGNGVVVALGLQSPHPNEEPRRRLSINQEARTVRRAMRSRREPISLPDATLVDIQDAALRRPFILHLAAHREFGATVLAGHDGNPTRVLDADLAQALAPPEGTPSAVMLSFCDSHEVAALMEDRDIAVISFHGEILDDGASAFYEYFYDALAVGRTIGLAFEVASGAVRGDYGLTVLINPYSSAHDRPLPL